MMLKTQIGSRRARVATAVGLTLVCAVVLLGTAWADAEPLNGGTRTITLYNCSGPSGTPGTFTIQKESGIVTSFHVVDSTTMFIPTSLTDVTAGVVEFSYPGFNKNAVALVTCNITRPTDGEVFSMTGFFSHS